MRDLAAIAAAHADTDAHLERRRTDALAHNDSAEVDRVERRQQISDQAYFVLCWGQLEVAVDDACRDAIRRRGGDPNWDVRRAWDLYDPDDKRLSGLGFEDRLALLVDRRAGRGSAWAKAMSYYGVRNQIAHGRLRPGRIDVTAVVKDFYVIQGHLAP